jgi:hypothetical protein
VCALSAIAHALMRSPETAGDVATRIAPRAQLDPALVQRAAARVREQLAEAAAH